MVKQTCPICFRLLRSKCFSYNPREKKLLCNRCNNKVGTYKFYDPLWKQKKKKRKIYYLKRDEKEFIIKEELKKGKEYEEGKEKIKNIINQLQISRDKLQKEELIKKENKSMQKKLVKGLGLK